MVVRLRAHVTQCMRSDGLIFVLATHDAHVPQHVCAAKQKGLGELESAVSLGEGCVGHELANEKAAAQRTLPNFRVSQATEKYERDIPGPVPCSH